MSVNEIPKVKLYKIVDNTQLYEFESTNFKHLKTTTCSVLYGLGLDDGEEDVIYTFNNLEDAQYAVDNVTVDSDTYEEYTLGSKWYMRYYGQQTIRVKVTENVWILESDGMLHDNIDPIFLCKLIVVKDKEGCSYSLTSINDEIRDNLKKEIKEFGNE